MRTGSLLFSAIHFLLVVFLLCGGAFFLLLAYVPAVRMRIGELLTEQLALAALVGYLLLSIGTLFLCGLFALYRGHYYQIQMGPHTVVVEEGFLRQYIQAYWRDHFPRQDVLKEVTIFAPQKIELLIELSDEVWDEHKALLKRIERELLGVLRDKFGYGYQLLVTVLIK